MRNTNIQPLIDAIKAIEETELIAALKAHGGSFVFDKEEKEQTLPPIEFYDDYKGPSAGDVLEARLKKNTTNPKEEKEAVVLTIIDEDRDSYDIEAETLYPGMISGITARIPEPEKP